MPEGDTVWRSARNLDRALAGQVLTRCDLRVPSVATVDLTGQPVHGVVSRGKHLLMRIGESTVHSHLKMEGSWHLYPPEGRWRRPAHSARAVLGTATATAVGFSLGMLEVFPTADEAAHVGHLGPDLLGADWDAAEALARLGREPGRAVGQALLDQRNLAGVGNIYRCELCFLAGVHPLTAVADVPALPRLIDRAHRLLLLNREQAAIVTTGSTRRGEENWVYGRAGRPCRRCGTPIRKDQAGNTDLDVREYWFCPTCQPVPVHPGDAVVPAAD
ncbi:DNA glycosylase [Tersicoccus phoenicis]|uniref:DNA-(apurinic or apyrimidinic site) lyase n=1 Tax=Tersicoccus phoenicis TaxID=554083 RepID=A0A1R1L7P9_9MICC|nr:DNA-formamidopyrimidine glycosylase family protein [Tersicoccus phoenicis]OMH23563.1 DNA glycosylase [Tersicoccus phoenicis]